MVTDLRILASGLRFPEGPVAMSDGSVLVVEVARGTLTRVLPDGELCVIAELGGGPNGAAVGPDGKVYVCNNGGSMSWRQAGELLLPGACPDSWQGGCIQRVDLNSGAVEVLYTHSSNGPLRGPNDLVFDDDGGFWFTEYGVALERSIDLGGIHYATIDGSHCEEVVFPLQRPNGVALSPDRSRLYVAETHAARVWSWDLAGPGRLQTVVPVDTHHRALSLEHSEPGVASTSRPIGACGGVLLAGLSGLQLLDSMAVDAEGYVCVATFVNGGITAISPDGQHIEHIPLPDPLPTNICFGGAGLRTAYVTLSGTGRLVALTWPRPGLKLPYSI